jgi:hypothetical protein
MGTDTAEITKDGKVVSFKMNGNTYDIIEGIKQGDAQSIDYVLKFAPSVLGSDIATTCHNLYNFVTTTIPYKEDPPGRQDIQLPGELYSNRFKHLGGTGKGGDCKSMSLFCSSVLRALGIYNFEYAFTAANANDDVHHVYLQVYDVDPTGTPYYIPLDCTLPEFGIEAPFAKKQLMAPHKPDRIGEFNFFKIGTTYTESITVSEYEKNLWQNQVDELRKSFWAMSNDLGMRCVKNVWDAHKSRPIQYSEFEKALLKNWNSFLDGANVCIYYYWNNASLLPYTMCQLNPNQPQDIPFPAQYDIKRNTANQLVDAFKRLGLTDANILTLVTLSVFKTYGISLEYMLYRCYCIELYGQPFKPHANIPYWNNTLGRLENNGADLGVSLNLVVCFPAQGGISRPAGQPYWSTGGHVIGNGASQQDIELFALRFPRPGTPINGDPQNVVPGTIVNNGAGIPFEAQQQALVIYNRWCLGNMVMLDQPKPGTGGFGGQIGTALPVAEIIGIVVAVIAAVTTVVTVVAKLVEIFKHPENGDKIALPMQDFTWDYQSNDGCIIGHCNQLGGCNGAQMVKMCNGTITEINPDVNDPANQPAAPGDYFTGTNPKNKKLLWGAAALGLAGVGMLMLSGSEGDKQ